MRTMFISLVLIWSLAQLASTQPSPVTTFKPEGCDRTTYNCYVPERCISTSTKTAVAGLEIKQLKSDHKIKSDCEALIRFHLYDQHWALVSIESFSPTAKNIELSSKATTTPENRKFSCTKIDLGGGKYMYEPKFKTTVYVNMEKDTSKFKCTFEITLKNTEKIFYYDNGVVPDNVLILKVGDDETIKEDEDNANFPAFGQIMCNPNKFTTDRKKWIDKTKVYREATYDLGTFSCKDHPIFKIEFAKEEVSPNGGPPVWNFEKMNNFICVGSGSVGTKEAKRQVTKATEDDDFEIRCVADAHFFCRDGVKNKAGKSALIHVPSNLAAGTASSLTCPPDARHLVVKEDEKPYKNAEFECLNYGETQFWTVKGENSIILDKDDPVYCTNDLECHLQLRIQESSVEAGDLDETNFVPKCFNEGTLHVKVGSVKTKINPPYCNLKTGKFEYTHLDKPAIHEIAETTKFICTYPEPKDEPPSSVDVQTVVAGSIGGFIGAGAAALAIILVLAFFATRREKKAMTKQKLVEAKNRKIVDVAYMHYCLDADEKKAYTRKKLGMKDDDVVATEEMITPPAPDEECTYNKMLMSFQNKALEFAGGKLTMVTETKTKETKDTETKDKETKDKETSKDKVPTQKEKAQVEIVKDKPIAPFAADPEVAAANKAYTLWHACPAKTVPKRKVPLPENIRKQFKKIFLPYEDRNDLYDGYLEDKAHDEHLLTKEKMKEQLAQLKKA